MDLQKIKGKLNQNPDAWKMHVRETRASQTKGSQKKKRRIENQKVRLLLLEREHYQLREVEVQGKKEGCEFAAFNEEVGRWGGLGTLNHVGHRGGPSLVKGKMALRHQ